MVVKRNFILSSRPDPQENEVLVRVNYAGVIPIDFKIRNGWLHNLFPQSFPFTPGSAISGVIESVGPGITILKPGDRVFGAVKGAYAQYAIAQPDELVLMPDNLSMKDAAAIRAGADSAWKALFTEGNLEAGQTVLIHAAAGGVGQFAVQLAKWKGATVIGTASTSNIDFVQSLGADQVIDYTKTPFENVVQNVDLVVDAVGSDTEDRSWPIIKHGGILVSLTQFPSQEKAKEFGVISKFNTKFPTPKDLEKLAQLIANGTIKAEIDTVYPLKNVRTAHKQSEISKHMSHLDLEL
jgi:NADPH:quinone reductase-like Zn-dependent oxidoreductase